MPHILTLKLIVLSAFAKFMFLPTFDIVLCLLVKVLKHENIITIEHFLAVRLSTVVINYST